MPGHPDVVIIGGGVVGSAVAYFLRRDGDCRVTVVERDPTYARASSALSASSIRQQFSCPVNIALSRFGIGFLRSVGEHLAVNGEAPAIGLREPGYLYLAGPAGVDVLQANYRVQRAHEVAVALLDPAGLRERFPWMEVAGVAAGSLGLADEGWFDGPALMQAFRRKARALGAQYVHAEAVGFERDGTAIRAVRLAGGERLPCGAVVNAAGPYARAVAGFAGLRLPVEARKRSVFVLQCKESLPGCPLVIDTSGVWFRPEGDRFLAGWSPPEEDDPEELGLDVDHELFERVVWPALAARVPAFEAVRVSGAWAGHYEYNTFDHNALLGRMEAAPNLYFANGFSGHGMQQAAGAGRGISELILHGQYRTIDLSDLDVSRVDAGRPLRELNII
jgi:FAD-dependent oxidoreductase domain-containing protein 1